MKNQFVPYDIALKLKELGFNDKCFDFYDDNKELFYHHDDDKFHLGEGVKAPLYQQTFQFLRDNFNFSGNIDCCDNLSTWNIKSSKLDKGIYSNKIQSYNDAQIDCIQEIIKLIENEQ